MFCVRCSFFALNFSSRTPCALCECARRRPPVASSLSAPVPLARASSRFELEFALLRASHTHSRAHSHCRSHSHSHSTRTRALAHSLLSALGNFCSFRSSTLMCLLSFRCAALLHTIIPEFQLYVTRAMDHRSKSHFLETPRLCHFLLVISPIRYSILCDTACVMRLAQISAYTHQL